MKPLLVYDGECGFCRTWVTRWRAVLGDRIDYAPFQEVADRFPQVPREEFARALHFIEPDGRITRGAEAAFRSLALAPGHEGWLWFYRWFPGFRPVSEAFYRLVARNRDSFFVLTRWFYGPNPPRPGEGGFMVSRGVFLRLLALVYFIAFVSLWIQIDGLMGSSGILPVGEWMPRLADRLGAKRFLQAPTLLWLHPGDTLLHVLAAGGSALSALLFFGAAPAVVLFLLWAFYLSLCTAGNVFLGFQWDALLVETGFLAILLAPRALWSRPSLDPPPSRLGLFLSQLLLFKLIFSSGAVKLASGDPTWRDLTALTYHYETQPLPTWTSWMFHQLPIWFHKVSAVIMFAIELVAAFLIFAPRRLRHFGAAAILLLQILIFLTGNYGFFNLLTVALWLFLLDDAIWPAWLRARFAPYREAGGTLGRTWPRGAIVGVGTVLLILNLVRIGQAFRRPLPWPAPVRVVADVTGPFQIVNGYGLFAVMTTQRPEIVMEGSQDGESWQAYEFKYKPGDVKRKPGFVAPHMPRLDWQMWFAALGEARENPWFLRFCGSLLDGRRPVSGLLEENPFPDDPPRFVRALLYDYHFTSAAERRETGAWWRRESKGVYLPAISLRPGPAQPDQ